MDPKLFERLVIDAWNQMPERFKERVHNVALLIEEEPSEQLRKEQNLGERDTLLGYYHGIPATKRGALYGVGVTLPDTITLFRLPLIAEAHELLINGRAKTEEDALRLSIQETLWHEVAHYFGLEEHSVHQREKEGTNQYQTSRPE